jgi:hypothetical protein
LKTHVKTISKTYVLLFREKKSSANLFLIRYESGKDRHEPIHVPPRVSNPTYAISAEMQDAFDQKIAAAKNAKSQALGEVGFI